MPCDEQLVTRIRELLIDEPQLDEQRMFGGLAFLIGGNMSVAASAQGDMLVRFDPALTDDYLAEPHTDPFVMRDRQMDGWLRVAPAGTANSTDLERWVRRGVRFARTLPAKR